MSLSHHAKWRAGGFNRQPLLVGDERREALWFFEGDRPGMDGKKQTSHWELPALDGLRGLAILLVVWCHLGAFGQAAGLDMPTGCATR
jgi:hypothetical protein